MVDGAVLGYLAFYLGYLSAFRYYRALPMVGEREPSLSTMYNLEQKYNSRHELPKFGKMDSGIKINMLWFIRHWRYNELVDLNAFFC